MSGLTSNTVTEAQAFKWVGDNLGLGSDVPATIHARDQDGRLTDLSIEETLRHIDMFDEPGRTRILVALPYEYNIPPEDAATGRGGANTVWHRVQQSQEVA